MIQPGSQCVPVVDEIPDTIRADLPSINWHAYMNTLIAYSMSPCSYTHPTDHFRHQLRPSAKGKLFTFNIQFHTDQNIRDIGDT